MWTDTKPFEEDANSSVLNTCSFFSSCRVLLNSKINASPQKLSGLSAHAKKKKNTFFAETAGRELSRHDRLQPFLSYVYFTLGLNTSPIPRLNDIKKSGFEQV